jgi:23S rRNA (adenine1618-N6)-methyltransferase
VHENQYGTETIDFFNTQAVQELNKSLLMHYYGASNWEIPQGYLSPPIPGRADYIHHVADLLAADNKGRIPTTNKIKVLDIGVGANCVYPIIGNSEYGWGFIGSEIDAISMAAAKKNANYYSKRNFIEFRLQVKSKDVFHGILKRDACIDLTICNPPFHSSAEEAQKSTLRKVKNLKGKEAAKEETLKLAGQSNEMWCKGGEARFVKDMIYESRNFKDNSIWFTTLISKESNLKQVYRILKDVNAVEVKTIPMGQGQKKSRIVAWTFQSKEQKQLLVKARWSLT